ncbi:MAG: Sec-independent protein translocase protein TatB [Thermodesulfovibrionales bacterium]
MFDIGFQELIIIFIVALLVFGPKKLPEIANTLGKGIAELKKAMDNVRTQVHEEIKDIKNPVDPIKLKEQLYSNIEEPIKKAMEEPPQKTDKEKPTNEVKT